MVEPGQLRESDYPGWAETGRRPACRPAALPTARSVSAICSYSLIRNIAPAETITLSNRCGLLQITEVKGWLLSSLDHRSRSNLRIGATLTNQGPFDGSGRTLGQSSRPVSCKHCSCVRMKDQGGELLQLRAATLSSRARLLHLKWCLSMTRSRKAGKYQLPCFLEIGSPREGL